MSKFTEKQITQALKERHNKRGDYFASQVKMGSFGSKILDAIAIPVTWSPVTIIGYEIKVSRADFMHDQKHPHYMSTCHLFYFVVPKGIIQKDEVPETVGIMEYNNGKLRIVKKAAYRKVDINPHMLLHMIFYKLNEYERPKTRQEHLDDLKARTESSEYGSEIAKKIAELRWKLRADGKEDEWDKFVSEFKKIYGISVRRWEVFQYISLDNKKCNVSMEYMERMANLLELYKIQVGEKK